MNDTALFFLAVFGALYMLRRQKSAVSPAELLGVDGWASWDGPTSAGDYSGLLTF